jgi:hypothetical protein
VSLYPVIIPRIGIVALDDVFITMAYRLFSSEKMWGSCRAVFAHHFQEKLPAIYSLFFRQIFG